MRKPMPRRWIEGRRHACLYPTCDREIRTISVACDDHWDLLTENLKVLVRDSLWEDAYYRVTPMPNRKAVLDLVEKFFVIRHRLTELAA